VPSGDEAKLVESLVRLVSDSLLRAQYAVRSREFARSHFHIQEVCRRFEELYLEVTENKART
jgi:hypothetical protein